MKPLSARANIRGFTLLDTLVVLFVLFIVAAMLMPTLAGSHRAPGQKCMSNLRQIEVGFYMYWDDNGRKFPMQVSVTNGGTMEFINSGHTFSHFQKVLGNQHDPRFLVCPLDKTRKAATNFQTLTDLNLSYFLNADVVTTGDPAHSILAGDRLLQVNGLPVKPGLFLLTTNLNLGWTPKLHGGFGNLAFADGHVEMIRSTNLKKVLQNQPLATNRLCVP
jgi:prepilin-type processing-associated H-X9-DG protein